MKKKISFLIWFIAEGSKNCGRDRRNSDVRKCIRKIPINLSSKPVPEA
jgi:hypothetical protein